MMHKIPTDWAKIGRNLIRPECVLTHASGDLFCSHGAHGIARLRPDGTHLALAGKTDFSGQPILANGIALRSDGSFLVANIADAGGLFELDADGLRLFHPCTANGVSPPVNFVLIDELGKIWITVSSTFSPRSLAYRPNVANGYVAVIENGEMKIVVENLAYTNEIRTDYENGWLYIAETMGQRISRVRLDERGVHGTPVIFAQLPTGSFADGVEVAADGSVLAVCIISAELHRISPDGHQSLVLGERFPDWIETVQSAFEGGKMGRPHLDTSPTQRVRNISSVAFRGEDFDEMVFGNILESNLFKAKADFRGRRPLHWDVPVPVWGQPF